MIEFLLDLFGDFVLDIVCNQFFRWICDLFDLLFR